MYIRDHEKRALNIINRLNPHNAHKLVGVGFGPTESTEITYMIRDFIRDVGEISSFDDLLEVGLHDDEIDMLYHWSLEQVREKHLAHLEKKELRLAAKTMNRCRYLPEGVLQYREFTRQLKFNDGTTHTERAQGWKYDTMLKSLGLLNIILQDIWGENKGTVAVQLVNMLPKAIHPSTGEELNFRKDVPAAQWENANNHGIAVSGERLGWNMNSRGWGILKEAFPNAVWLSAYGHGLNSPVLPYGDFRKVEVLFKTLVDEEGNELGTDGSGLWNVDHPVFEAFIAKHGICAWQIRGLHPKQGVFVKGAVRPVSLGADEPPFILDWNQVKGKKKVDALRNRELRQEFVQKNMYIGCLQVWNKPRATLKSCFEMLENIKVNKRTTEIVKDLIDDAIERLRRLDPDTGQPRGIDRIIGRICNDDERLALIVQLVNMLRERGADIHPGQIPMVRKAVKAKLERIVWHIAQGAGITYKQRLCILDNTVEPGTIVATGVKPGTVVTTFRFPMVLAQGLRTLTAAAPKPHMLCHGKEVECVVFMNPHDLTTCMQGDDDGDIVGISTDPRMAELFEHLIDNNIYHIEPEGKKIWYDVDSSEGLEYLRFDQRGPVGLATNYRSSLLAVGDIAGANAMSITIQECVDAAKRKPEWSDFRKAVNLENWEQDENGEFHFHHRLAPEDLEQGDLPLELMSEWVAQRLIERGCVKTIYEGGEAKVVPDNACAWRWPGKKIDLDKWVPTSHRTKYPDGNLVHICHDYAYQQFMPIRDEFKLDADQIELSMLLSVMLAQVGISTKVLCEDWITYSDTVRKKAGLTRFGDVMRRIHSKQPAYDREELHRRIDQATKELNDTLEQANLTVNEIVTIWVMETTRRDKDGNQLESGINNAFRVLSTPGNQVMLALGITKQATCDWMLRRVKVTPKQEKELGLRTKNGTCRRLDLAVAQAMRKSNPQEWLSNAIFKDLKHGKDCHDEDSQPIQLWECTHCRSTVTNALVQAIRSDRESTENQWLRRMMSTLNHG